MHECRRRDGGESALTRISGNSALPRKLQAEILTSSFAPEFSIPPHAFRRKRCLGSDGPKSPLLSKAAHARCALPDPGRPGRTGPAHEAVRLERRDRRPLQALTWLGYAQGVAGRWGLAVPLLLAGLAATTLAALLYRNRSAHYELNRQQWGEQIGYLGFAGLFGVFAAAQVLSSLLFDAATGLLPQLGLAVVLGLMLWLGMRAWQRRTARSIADGSALAQI